MDEASAGQEAGNGPSVDGAPSAPRPVLPVLEYAGPATGGQVLLARFSEAAEAHMAAGKLELESVGCTVLEGSTALAVTYGLVGRSAVILVPHDEVERAVAVLAQTPARRCLVEPWRPPELSASHAPHCPCCGSEGARRTVRWRGIIIAGVLLSWLLALGTQGLIVFGLMMLAITLIWRATGPWWCTSCGHSWDADDEQEREDDEDDEEGGG